MPTPKPPKRTRHVLAGNAKRDISAVLKAATGGKSLRWRVPKDSHAGDPVIFYLPGPGFTARGVISTEPRKYDHGRYTARVRDVVLLASAVPLAFAQKNFPAWGWLNARIKSYTTIDESIRQPLEKILREYQASFAEPLTEATPKTVSVTIYERNPLARQQCIAHYKARCHACGFSFGETYGETAEGYIHVHHLNPMASGTGKRAVDPIKDLRPICPNCHAVIHLQNPPLSIVELKRMLKQARSLA